MIISAPQFPSSGPLQDTGTAHMHSHPQCQVWMYVSKASIVCSCLISQGFSTQHPPQQAGPPCGPI